MKLHSKHNTYSMIAAVFFFVCLIGAPVFGATSRKNSGKAQRQATYCNPVDLPYRFQLSGRSRREAADPTIITFRGEYWLFPSKSGGYWHSSDLLHWDFVPGVGYPVENYAPTALVMNEKVYLTMSDTIKLFVTDNPLDGQWAEAADFGQTYGDPALFLDDDGRVYMYAGVSAKDVLHVTELDPKDGFKALRTEAIPLSRSAATRGWEVAGDSNNDPKAESWIEGSWVNKHDGKYYLQYAAPGTQFKTYADGVLVSDKPMGPFTYAPYSPFSFKPTGFVTGAGHSSTFAGFDGRFWHIATMTISARHMFERRLGLFPTSFTKDGELITDTYLGDYPHYIGGDRGLTGWMLLSRKKTSTASSTLEGHEPGKAVDEDIRSWWSAKTGDPGEWFQIDLGGVKTIDAVQINFADEGSTAMGRSEDVYKYVLELSYDGKRWSTAIDHEMTGKDSPHDYEVLQKPVKARYLKLKNVHSPNGAIFSISDLRVFGNGHGAKPGKVTAVTATRDASDPRHLTVHWQSVPNAEFYIVRIGTTPAALIQNYQVYDQATSADIRSLNIGVGYYVGVDAVNENGITKATSVIRVP
jgi:hypothetical protein